MWMRRSLPKLVREHGKQACAAVLVPLWAQFDTLDAEAQACQHQTSNLLLLFHKSLQPYELLLACKRLVCPLFPLRCLHLLGTQQSSMTLHLMSTAYAWQAHLPLSCRE